MWCFLRSCQVLSLLRSTVEDVVGSKVSDSDPLMSGGLDSLGAVELKCRIETRFNVTLSATVAFDYPTIKVHTLSNSMYLW